MKQTHSSSARPDPETIDRVRWSTIIFVVALLVRMLHLWQLRSAPFFGFKLGDAETYDAWAHKIAAGHWLGEGVFYQAPLYPYFLGVIYRIFGDDVMVVYKCQAALGAVSCVLLALSGWRLFGKRAGLVAGFMLAFYAPAIFFDSLIQKSTLDLFFFSAWPLWWVSNLIVQPKRRHWLWLGITLGGFALVRENGLILIPGLLLWLCLQRSSYQKTQTGRRSLVAWQARLCCWLES